ncbi:MULTISPECIES: hypothetical protein [unclassified Streptomyces]|uniref:hypothetical protein n=1 Tax=unclassified Streptomyces TaxID=2593676 RepID=UPI00069059CE|nr:MULTISPECIES: hypothetical protein [unclassified Streptomyces]MCH0557755.1 hypothetical protein [Streptomyces sp. MUM 16J]
MIGDLSEIPEYSGDLDQLEKDAGALKRAASGIRDTGRDVHNDFQGLVSCYKAPEADQLFHTTIPVRGKADTFAKKLESVSGALSTFAKDARPLVQRLEQLRTEAAAFRKSIEGNHDWRKDQKNIDKNAHLVHEIGRVWGEFQELERSTATKIDGQVGGTRWVADDGSHKKGMYGFNADDAAKADDTPWGKVDEREYTGLAAAWQWTKHNVGGAIKGFFVDGVWDTLKGLGHMVNVFDWNTFTKTWSGIGDVFGGVSAYIMTPYDWAMDKMFGPTDHSDTDRQKKALRDFGKSLIAYDEWGKNPARAGGTVVFNVLTLGAGSFLKLGKAGSLAAKAGEAGDAASAVSRAAKVANALGKTGRLVDPMTYVGKGAGFAKLKIGDMMAGLKDLHSGAANDFLHGADSSKIPQTHAPVAISDKSVRYPDGSILHEDGTMVSPEGKPHQNPIPVESSTADRLARHEVLPPSHASSPSNVSVHAEQVPLHVGGSNAAHAGGAETSLSTARHGGDDTAGQLGGHPTEPMAQVHNSHTSLPAHAGSGGVDNGATRQSGHGTGGAGHSSTSVDGHDPGASLPAHGHSVDSGIGHGGSHTPGDTGQGNGHTSSSDAEHTPPPTPQPKPSSPAVVADQVRKANENPEWFNKYYEKDCSRRSVEARDENGYLLPKLRLDEYGNKVSNSKFPPSDPPSYKLPDHIHGDPATVHPDRVHDLQEAAVRRQASLDDLAKAKADKAAVEAAYKAHKTPVLKAQLDAAEKHLSKAHAGKTVATEMFGEKAAEYHAIPDHYPDARRLDGGEGGSDRFDQIWETKDGRIVVVEAKSSPRTELNDRWGSGRNRSRRVKQGTSEYFAAILDQMQLRGEDELAETLEKALDEGKLDYVLVKGNPNGSEYAGYVMNHFDIG